jgi:hypothetical protein
LTLTPPTWRKARYATFPATAGASATATASIQYLSPTEILSLKNFCATARAARAGALIPLPQASAPAPGEHETAVSATAPPYRGGAVSVTITPDGVIIIPEADELAALAEHDFAREFYATEFTLAELEDTNLDADTYRELLDGRARTRREAVRRLARRW